MLTVYYEYWVLTSQAIIDAPPHPSSVHRGPVSSPLACNSLKLSYKFHTLEPTRFATNVSVVRVFSSEITGFFRILVTLPQTKYIIVNKITDQDVACLSNTYLLFSFFVTTLTDTM